MKRVHAFLLGTAALLVMAAPAAAQQAPKWGYINSQRILAEAPGTQQAQQAFEKDMERYRGELQKLESELQKEIEDYEKQQAMLTNDQRQQRETALMQKQQQFQQRAMQLEQEAAQRQQELVEPVMQQIQGVISQIREEGNYAFIFDVASGAVISADPSLDLTDQVLTRLKSTASN